MMNAVPCTNPAHAVSTHVAGSVAARECSLSVRHRMTRSRAPLPTMSLAMTPAMPVNMASGFGRFGEFLEDFAPRELDRVMRLHPGYSSEQIAESAAEHIMDELPDVNEAWDDLPADSRRSSEGTPNVRTQRADISAFVERYILQTL